LDLPRDGAAFSRLQYLYFLGIGDYPCIRRESMKKGIRRLLIILSVLVVLAGVVIGVIVATKGWIASVRWEDPSLAQIADGDYPGEAAISLPPGTAAANPAVKIKVTVQDHRYNAFEIIDPPGVAPALLDFAKEIVAKQSLKVDAISGGTVTKVAFLKAIGDAIAKAPVQQ
jgi:uncharacterized protein with FMN-binding domain